MTKALPRMPEPPNYLLTQELEQLTHKLAENPASAYSSYSTEEYSPASIQTSALRTVDMVLYQAALEERKMAEIRSAEIYSKYLEIVGYSEKLINKVNAMERFKSRVRPVYDRAMAGDDIILENLNLAREDLDNARDLINSFNLKNQTLESAMDTHQQAFLQVSKQMAQAESAMQYANEQFQLLSADYERRGEKITDLEKILAMLELKGVGTESRVEELQRKSDVILDENMLLGNQLRQTQIHASGLETLNEELTQSIPKLQRQIHILEEKLRIEREDFEKQSASSLEELGRLRENKNIEGLVEKSRAMNRKTEVDFVGTASGYVSAESVGLEVKSPKQWNEFYQRWSTIIDELSSHSSPIRHLSSDDDLKRVQLTSELGDYEIE